MIKMLDAMQMSENNEEDFGMPSSELAERANFV